MAPNPKNVPISRAAARPRIHPTFRETLLRELGKRDWTKGERAEIGAIFVHMRSQAQNEGFPSLPLDKNDSAGMRALKAARLDGIAKMADERPELLQDGEHDLIELLLFEAAVHGLRPHAGHQRALPAHVVKIMREREAANLATPAIEVPAMPPSSADAHKRIDELHGRIDGMESSLAAILAAVKPAPAPAAPAASPPSTPPVT